MAVPKIAINGFGRIGRIVTRIAKLCKHFGGLVGLPSSVKTNGGFGAWFFARS